MAASSVEARLCAYFKDDPEDERDPTEAMWLEGDSLAPYIVTPMRNCIRALECARFAWSPAPGARLAARLLQPLAWARPERQLRLRALLETFRQDGGRARGGLRRRHRLR